MMRQQPFEAVVTDMDGVLTRTAALHERAWKQTFDLYLEERGRRAGAEQRPFSDDDYRRYVDGKPRLDGVREFLGSRGIEVPGQVVREIGDRKNGAFLELLGRGGVQVFGDALAALARWRRGGLPVAAVSSSKNCMRVIAAAGLTGRFDAIVGGEVAAELGLRGKPDILAEGARRLHRAPVDVVVLEDAVSGVRAARAGGFGLVAGIDRGGQACALLEAGADQVVSDVSTLRFPRRLPALLPRLGELEARRAGRRFAVFLDYDGTLTPIVDRPEAAWLDADMRDAVRKVAARWPVAVVSGRDRPDVQARVGIDYLVYAGDHGFDIAGPGRQKILPQAEAVIPQLHRAERELRKELALVGGALVERKRFSIAIHYRLVAEENLERVRRTVEETASATGLRQRAGKKVFELEPPVDWDKGKACRWLMEVLGVDPGDYLVLYLGDDETDEDAFGALGPDGAGIRVGGEVSTSLADYRLVDTGEVREVLRWLARP